MRKWLDGRATAGQDGRTGRPLRTQAGGLVCHVLNLANRRATLFERPGDYAAFLGVLAHAKAEHPVRLLGFGIMPNRWHLVVWPAADGGLTAFLRWLAHTNVTRWHAHYHTGGTGHVFQLVSCARRLAARARPWRVPCRTGVVPLVHNRGRPDRSRGAGFQPAPRRRLLRHALRFDRHGRRLVQVRLHLDLAPDGTGRGGLVDDR